MPPTSISNSVPVDGSFAISAPAQTTLALISPQTLHPCFLGFYEHRLRVYKLPYACTGSTARWPCAIRTTLAVNVHGVAYTINTTGMQAGRAPLISREIWVGLLAETGNDTNNEFLQKYVFFFQNLCALERFQKMIL